MRANKMIIKKIFEIVFFIALFLCVLSFSYEHTLFVYDDAIMHESFRVLRDYSLALFSIKFVYDIIAKNIKMRELIVIIVLLPLLIYLMVCFYDWDITTMRFRNIAIFSLLMVSGSDINYRKIIRYVLLFLLISYLSVIIIYLLGYLKNWTKLEISRYRQFLGFSWADIAYRFLFIVMYYIYYRGKKICSIELFILFAICLCLFSFTGARAPFMFTNLLILLSLLLRNSIAFEKWITSQIGMVVVITFLIPIFVVIINLLYNQNNQLMLGMNKLLSGRLQLGNEGILNNGVNLFGNYIEFIGGFGLNGYYDFVDSGFLNFLLIIN